MSLASCYIFKRFDFFEGWTPLASLHFPGAVYNLAALKFLYFKRETTGTK